MYVMKRLKDRWRRHANWYRRHVVKRPTRALLEPTNSCNLNCPFCLVGQQNKLLPMYGNAAHHLQSRPMGMLSETTFDRTRQQLKAFGIRDVLFYFQGEPLLHREFVRFASVLKRDGFWVGMFTNGLPFTDRNMRPLIATDIDLIRFSVDGATQETYGVNRVGGRFDRVYDNMRELTAAARGTRTRVEWQFIALRNNEHEIPMAERMARDIGINFVIKGYRVTDPKLAPENPRYHSPLLEKPCTDIYLQLVICWNGDVVPCCYDIEGEEVMGNINDESLSRIWNSPKYRDFRRRVDESRIHPEREPEICKNCLRWGSATHAGAEAAIQVDQHSTV